MLARFLDSADVIVRRSAAQALRAIASKTAIEPLVKALEDDDWEVRWVAVMGLAGIVGPNKNGQSWYPAYDGFKNDELKYLQHWREWAQKRARKR